MRAIVLTFDRLPAHLLSCLGNEWIETPEFDRLAAHSRVFEQHYVEIPSPAGPAHPWWTGRLEFFRGTADGDADSMSDSSATPMQRLQSAGVSCRLITERLEGLPCELFHEHAEVTGKNGLQVELKEVPFARLVESAIERLQAADSASGSSLLWLHSRGVPDAWIPPQFFAELYLEELDEPVSEAEVSEFDDETPPDPMTLASVAAQDFLADCLDRPDLLEVVLSEQFFAAPEDDDVPTDLDEDADGFEYEAASSIAHQTAASSATDDAAANDDDDDALDDDPGTAQLLRGASKLVCGGYVSLLDHWLGKLRAAISASNEPTMLVVSAAQGLAFGERDQLGNAVSSRAAIELQDALVKTPLIMWRSDAKGFGSRHQELRQTVDVPLTLLDWFGLATDSEKRHSLNAAATRDGGREHVLHLSPDGAIGIRDARHLLAVDSVSALRSAVEDDDGEQSLPRCLFVKPSDLWNIFDTAGQAENEVERLTELLKRRLPPASL